MCASNLLADFCSMRTQDVLRFHALYEIELLLREVCARSLHAYFTRMRTQDACRFVMRCAKLNCLFYLKCPHAVQDACRFHALCELMCFFTGNVRTHCAFRFHANAPAGCIQNSQAVPNSLAIFKMCARNLHADCARTGCMQSSCVVRNSNVFEWDVRTQFAYRFHTDA